MARMTISQKRLRSLARYYGRLAARDIDRAINHQRSAHWYGERPQFADLAGGWQRMSDQDVTHAASHARRAAQFARLSVEA